VEANVVAEMEYVGLRVGYLPALGDPWLDLEVLVAMNESVEDELAYALGLCVGSDTGIEVERAALNEHDDGIRRRFTRA
jgi:hypothetical protein